MADYAQKQSRNIGEAALSGQSTNDTRSADNIASLAATKALQAAAQQRIDQTRNPNEIGSTP